MTETRPQAQPDAPSPAAICSYLLEHPDFLLEHPDVLRLINLGRDDSTSLVQRQVRQLRAEMAVMDKKMQLARLHAEHGRMQLEHLHAMLPTLVAEDSAGGLLNVLAAHMRQRFGLPTCRMLAAAGGDGLVQMEPDDLATVARLCGRDGTFCGRLPALEARLLTQAMESAPCALASVALVAMPGDGMLLLGSDDETRFAGDLARDFIRLLAALLAALRRRLG